MIPVISVFFKYLFAFMNIMSQYFPDLAVVNTDKIVEPDLANYASKNGVLVRW